MLAPRFLLPQPKRAPFSGSLLTTLPVIVVWLLSSLPNAQAEVKAISENGFEVVHSRTIQASPQQAYDAVFQISQWWESSHTYSGNADNLSLEPRVGGQLLEKWQPGGAVEHMRVTTLFPPRSIHLQGALGPLAIDGLAGALVMRFSAGEEEGSCTIGWRYSVGGYRSNGFEEIAPAVDMVLAAQIDGLAKYAASVAAEATKPTTARPAEEDEASANDDGEVAVGEIRKLTEHTMTADGKRPANMPTAQASDFAFLVGHWQGPGLGGICEEVWSPPLGGEMQGMFQFVSGDKVQFRELFALRQEEGSWILRLKHFSADLSGWEKTTETVDFRLLQLSENKAIFDGLTMHRVGKETMLVHVAMKSGTSPAKEAEFRYTLTP